MFHNNIIEAVCILKMAEGLEQTLAALQNLQMLTWMIPRLTKQNGNSQIGMFFFFFVMIHIINSVKRITKIK